MTDLTLSTANRLARQLSKWTENVRVVRHVPGGEVEILAQRNNVTLGSVEDVEDWCRRNIPGWGTQ